VLPRLRQGDVKRFTAFGMSPTRELDDVCGARGKGIYRKSLLYLVSRSFEKPKDPDATEVPLVGMAHFAKDVVGTTSYAEAVAALKDDAGTLVWSPSSDPADAASDSTSHGGFDDDEPTMTSVLLRILGSTTVRPGNEFVPNLPPGASAAAVVASATDLDDQPPEVFTAEVQDGGPPSPRMPAAAAAPPGHGRTFSAARPGGGDADGTGNRVIDALMLEGWRVDRSARSSRSATKKAATKKAPSRKAAAKNSTKKTTATTRRRPTAKGSARKAT
jgi:hypothetical protein